MLPNIKLRGHLHRSAGKCLSVVTIISIDQHYQQKDEFKAFCLTMNEEYKKKNLLKLTVVETGYLKRHYLRLDKKYPSTEEADVDAIQLGTDWVKEQLCSLNLLKMPVEIISWKDLKVEGYIKNQLPETMKLGKKSEVVFVFKNTGNRPITGITIHVEKIKT